MSYYRIVFILNRPCAHACMKATIVDKNIKLKTWRVFAWRPVAPLGENTTDGRRKLATYKCVVSSPGGANGRHANTRNVLSFTFCLLLSHFRMAGRQAKTRRMSYFVFSPFCLHARILAGFRVATFRSARQRCDKQEAKRRRMKSVVLSRDDLSPRHKHVNVSI